MRFSMGMVWCVAALAVLPASALAQDVSWGVKGGVVFGSLAVSGSGAFDTSADPGGMAGGFVGLGIGRFVRVQPEVYWSVRRFSVTGVAAPFAVTAKGVEIPILIQVRVPDGRAWQATMFAGPQVAFLGTVTQELGTTSTDIDDLVKDHDAGVVVGAGAERALGRGAFVADVRAVIGMRNLSESGGPSQKSRAVQVLVGFRF